MNARAVAGSRSTVGLVLVLRIGYGLALIAAPERMAKRWLGRSAGRGPTQVPLRALGMREVVLHAGGLVALSRGAPLRPWLLGSVAGDLTDVTSTWVARSGLPKGAPAATVLVGGGAAILSLVMAAATPE